MKDDRILKALDALKHLDRELEAPPRVEAALLEAYRRRHARRGLLYGWFQGMAIATVAAALVMAFSLGRSSKAPARPTIALRPVSATLPIEPSPIQVEQVVIPQVKAQPVAVPVRSQPRAVQSREVVTDFFPLMDVAPPLGRGQILRVTVPASTMRSVGLPVREERLNDRVQADVLVGEEGMARAIRFVSIVQNF